MLTWTDQALRAEVDYRGERANEAMGHGGRRERIARRWLGNNRRDGEDEIETDPEEPSEQYRPAA